jgi:hypothetical protein
MQKLNLVALQQQVELLAQQQAQTIERITWIERVFETYGIKGLWLSPGKAAPLLGVSRDRIMTEIERAEGLRALGKRGDLVYGTHYRNIQDLEVEQPTWQIQVANFDQVLAIPPDQRKVG